MEVFVLTNIAHVLILVCVEVSVGVAALCELTTSGRTVLILVCVEVSVGVVIP